MDQLFVKKQPMDSRRGRPFEVKSRTIRYLKLGDHPKVHPWTPRAPVPRKVAQRARPQHRQEGVDQGGGFVHS